MDLASSSPRPAGFLSELLSIVQDRQVVALAVRWAADHELAEDALQTAYCQVATAPHPEAIVNLRAYFLRTLKNEITSTYSVRLPVPVDDLEAVTPPQPSTTLYGRTPERAVADQACATAQTQVWVNRHAARHDELIARSRPAPPTRPATAKSSTPRPSRPSSATSASSPTTPPSPRS